VLEGSVRYLEVTLLDVYLVIEIQNIL